MADADKNVRLVSVEGESYEVPLDVAKMSELVKNMIDDVRIQMRLLFLSILN